MLSIGSKCIADLSWPERFAVRGTGDGARLANCGSGENEKFGLNGMVRPEPLVFGRFRDPWLGGGVCGGTECPAAGRLALFSPGLAFELLSEVPASEGLDLRITGGWVADVGVGSGGGCDCVEIFEAAVDLRFLFGWPLEYCRCCDGRDRGWKFWLLPTRPLLMYILLRCSIL